jgi:hypothetical protein
LSPLKTRLDERLCVAFDLDPLRRLPPTRVVAYPILLRFHHLTDTTSVK